MSDSMKLAQASLTELVVGLGVDAFVLCSGARNGPLAKAIKHYPGIPVYDFFHENSAGYFALGLAKAGKRPAVFTTSGTAVAQLLSPCIEAFHDGKFIAFVTADRPKVYRFTGAPQTMDQTGIFDGFVSKSFDFEKTEDILPESLSPQLPLHMNLCFDHPLWWGQDPTSQYRPVLSLSKGLVDSGPDQDLQDRAKKQSLDDFFEQQDPQSVEPLSLFVFSRMDELETSSFHQYLKPLVQLAIVETSSGLTKNDFAKDCLIINDYKELARFIESGVISRVLHLGGVPTTGLWRDLAGGAVKLPVLSFGKHLYSGLTKTPRFAIADLEQISKRIPLQPAATVLPSEITKKISLNRDRLKEFEKQFPQSEYSLISKSWLDHAPEAGVHYVGNSMPIRYLDLMRPGNSPRLSTNRGLNGIDGQVSSFLGECVGRNLGGRCLLGDLTFLYDPSGLWALRFCQQLEIEFFVVNNGGGRIFDRVFDENPFLNAHEISLAKVFEAYSVFSRKHKFREIKPDLKQTRDFWKQWSELCK